LSARRPARPTRSRDAVRGTADWRPGLRSAHGTTQLTQTSRRWTRTSPSTALPRQRQQCHELVISGVTLNLIKPTVAGVPTTVTWATIRRRADIDRHFRHRSQRTDHQHPEPDELRSLDADGGPAARQRHIGVVPESAGEHPRSGQVGNTGAASSLASLGITRTPRHLRHGFGYLGQCAQRQSGGRGQFFRRDQRHRHAAQQLDQRIHPAGGLLDSINQGLQSSLTDVATSNGVERAACHLLGHAHQGIQRHGHAVALLKQTQTY